MFPDRLGRQLAALFGAMALSTCTARRPVDAPPAVTIASSAPSASASAAPATLASASASPAPAIATIARDEGVGLALGPEGNLGAWLSLGPFRVEAKSSNVALADLHPALRRQDGAPDGKRAIDDGKLRALFDGDPYDGFAARIDVAVREDRRADVLTRWATAPAKWTVAHTKPGADGEGALDLLAAFDVRGRLPKETVGLVGYLGATLRVPTPQRLTLLVGSDDGCEVLIDGVSRFVREGSRPQRDDDDYVSFDAAAGDHSIVLKLRQIDGGWSVRARVVDAALRSPVGVRVLLPFSAPSRDREPAIAAELARDLSIVAFARTPLADAYSFSARVRYPDGAPLDAKRSLDGSIVAGDGAILSAPHALDAVAIGPRGVVDSTVDVATISAVEVEKHETVVARLDVAGRTVEGTVHPSAPVRTAIASARALLDRWSKEGRPPTLDDDVAVTLDHLATRLSRFVASGDADLTSQIADAASLAALVDAAAACRDPIADARGPIRLAHRARFDGHAQELALYVPPALDKLPKEKRLPLYVVLHGMNGGDMAALRVFFGGDDAKKTMGELDRSASPARSSAPDGMVPDLAAFVLAPNAYGNGMYRQLGEDEVMDAVAWARARFPRIDASRVYITGFSMGGTGAMTLPLHHPDVFAASEPLCGYHSYAIRRDVGPRPQRPWERFLVADRSDVSWVHEGLRLPVHLVHGLEDLPPENGSVLVDAYEKASLKIEHDEPDLGHDVWGWAYDRFAQVRWLETHVAVAHPRNVHVKTSRPRFGDDAWVHLDRMERYDAWATIDGYAADLRHVRLRTNNVAALHVDRDATLIGDGAIELLIDGTKIDIAAGQPIVLHREGKGWKLGAASQARAMKGGAIAGPIRDVWSEPLTFVYGASDPMQTTANKAVAEALASVRWGVDAHYPIVADTDVDPSAPPATSMVLVGNAASNRLLAAVESALPIRIVGGAVHVGDRTIEGDDQLGTMFVVAHPRSPIDAPKYLLVVEGVTPLGTLRALSLPDLLPDFVVYDSRVAPSRGLPLLTYGVARAAGFFDDAWQVASDATIDDPLFAAFVGKATQARGGSAYLP